MSAGDVQRKGDYDSGAPKEKPKKKSGSQRGRVIEKKEEKSQLPQALKDFRVNPSELKKQKALQHKPEEKRLPQALKDFRVTPNRSKKNSI